MLPGWVSDGGLQATVGSMLGNKMTPFPVSVFQAHLHELDCMLFIHVEHCLLEVCTKQSGFEMAVRQGRICHEFELG